MNKSLISKISVVATVLSGVAPMLALAQLGSGPGGGPTTVSGLGTVLCSVFNILFFGLIIITVFFIVLAAFKYLTAGGDPEKVKTASKDLMFAAIAIVVVFLAKGFPSIVVSLFGGGQVGSNPLWDAFRSC